VLASKGSIYGLVLYTGIETRTQMNNTEPKQKRGKLDIEINNVTKVLFFVMFGCSILMVILSGAHHNWAT